MNRPPLINNDTNDTNAVKMNIIENYNSTTIFCRHQSALRGLLAVVDSTQLMAPKDKPVRLAVPPWLAGPSAVASSLSTETMA